MGVFGIVATVYGGYTLIYHFNHSNKLSVYSLVLLILGSISLLLFLSIYIPSYFARKKKKEEPLPPTENNSVEEEVEKTLVEEEKPTPSINPEPKIEYEEPSPRPQRERVSSSSSYVSTVYVKQVGYGPLLRIEGNRIIDMRTNTYYRIENNMVNQEEIKLKMLLAAIFMN